MKDNLIFRTAVLIMSAGILLSGCIAADSGTETNDKSAITALSEAVTSDEPINETMREMLDDGGSFPAYEAESSRNTVDLSGYALIADDPDAADSNTDIINRAIRKAGHGTTILFPEGRYYISASAKHAIRINGKEELYLLGSKTELINASFDAACDGFENYGDSLIMHISDSRRITLEGFTIDYRRHATAEGEILEQKDGKTLFRLPPDFDGDTLPLTGGEYCMAASFFEKDGTILGDEVYFGDDENIRLHDEGDGIFSVNRVIGKTGQRLLLRLQPKNGSCPLFPMTGNEDLAFRDLRVYSSPSAIVIATDGNRNLLFDGVVSEVREGIDRLYSSNVDCLHIADMRGKLVVKNCRFIGIGDDALNIHSMASKVGSLDGNVMLLENRGGHAPGKDWASAGDTVEFFDKKLSSLGRAVVKKFDGSRLTPDTLPENADKCVFVHNLSASPVTYVENCYVERSRARALLIQSKKAVVKDCTFRNIRLSALLISPDFARWFEGGFVDDLLITGNTFEKCCLGRPGGYGVITASNCHDDPSGAVLAEKSHRNITVTGNVFTDCPAKDAVLLCTQNTVVE